MVTNSLHPVASGGDIAPEADGAQADGLGGRVIDRVRQIFCGLHGHDSMLQFKQDRMFLRCVSCGHETPGWSLDEAPPTVTARGDTRRHAIIRPHLVGARRIA
jgi:hypothetical protein